MSYQVIARRWRPQKFEDVTGLTRPLSAVDQRSRNRSRWTSFWRLLFLTFTFATAGLASVQTIAAQSPAAAPPFGPPHVGNYDPIREDERRQMRSGIYARREYGPSKEDRVIRKGLLAPSIQDREDSQAFLQNKDTGLVRLLPREVYDWRTYHTVKRLDTQGGGAYYSFYLLTHEYGYGSDIELDHNNFSVGFDGPDYGMLAELGDVPLADFSADNASAAFLAQYQSARTAADARCEFKRFSDGLEASGITYKRTLPVHAGSTYLLRSINYPISDQLVAFRVLRQDEDGSVTIAWKLLKKWYRPHFEKVLYVNPIDKCPIK